MRLLLPLIPFLISFVGHKRRGFVLYDYLGAKGIIILWLICVGVAAVFYAFPCQTNLFVMFSDQCQQ